MACKVEEDDNAEPPGGFVAADGAVQYRERAAHSNRRRAFRLHCGRYEDSEIVLTESYSFTASAGG